MLLSGEPYKRIGAAHNKSGLQAAYRWLLQREPKAAYVVAADDRAYLEEDIDVFDFELTPDEISVIDVQRSCRAGQAKPCSGAGCVCWPYWPGAEDCCNVDGKGGHCKAW